MAAKGKELNPATCTFVKQCNPGQVRNSEGKCVSEKKSKMVKRTNGMLSNTVPNYAPLKKKSKSKRKKQIVKKVVIDNLAEKNVIPHYEYNSNNEELVTTNNNPLNKQKTQIKYRNRKRGKDKGTFGTTNKNGKPKSPARNSLNLLNHKLAKLNEPRPKKERKTKETVMNNNSGLVFNVERAMEVRSKLGNKLRQNTQKKYAKTQTDKFLGQGTVF